MTIRTHETVLASRMERPNPDALAKHPGGPPDILSALLLVALSLGACGTSDGGASDDDGAAGHRDAKGGRSSDDDDDAADDDDDAADDDAADDDAADDDVAPAGGVGGRAGNDSGGSADQGYGGAAGDGGESVPECCSLPGDVEACEACIASEFAGALYHPLEGEEQGSGSWLSVPPCSGLSGTMLEGPGVGLSNQGLCEEAYACFLDTLCVFQDVPEEGGETTWFAQPSVSPCWAGPDRMAAVTGYPTGRCRDAVEAAVGSSLPSDVINGYGALDKPLGTVTMTWQAMIDSIYSPGSGTNTGVNRDCYDACFADIDPRPEDQRGLPAED